MRDEFCIITNRNIQFRKLFLKLHTLVILNQKVIYTNLNIKKNKGCNTSSPPKLISIELNDNKPTYTEPDVNKKNDLHVMPSVTVELDNENNICDDDYYDEKCIIGCGLLSEGFNYMGQYLNYYCKKIYFKIVKFFN